MHPGEKAEELRDRKVKIQDQKIEELKNELQTLKQNFQGTNPSQSVGAGAEIGAGSGVAAAAGGNVHQQVDQSVKQVNQITLNIFGQESFAHITAAEVQAVLTRASAELAKLGLEARKKQYTDLQAAGVAVQGMMELVYADERAPENATCRLTSKKSSTVEVHGENGWEKRQLGAIAPVMRDQAMKAAFERQPMAEGSTECAAILKIMQEDEKQLKSDHSLASVRAVLERIHDHQKHLKDKGIELKARKRQIAPPQPTKLVKDEAGAGKPPREGMFLRPKANRENLSRSAEDALFDELYPPEPQKQLKALTVADVFEVLKEEGLAEESETIGKDRAMAVLARCAMRAAPWDEPSRRAALKAAERVFWEAAGAKHTEEATKERLRAVSLWGQASA
jgi:hypothetical protein